MKYKVTATYSPPGRADKETRTAEVEMTSPPHDPLYLGSLAWHAVYRGELSQIKVMLNNDGFGDYNHENFQNYMEFEVGGKHGGQYCIEVERITKLVRVTLDFEIPDGVQESPDHQLIGAYVQASVEQNRREGVVLHRLESKVLH